MHTPRPLSHQPIPEKAVLVFKGVMFEVYQWQQELFDGSFATFEKLKRADTALVIPVTAEGTIIFSQEEQPAKAPFLGLPGGQIEAGEDPLQAAQRELLEETGYQAEEWALLDVVQPVTKIDWVIYTYVARGCRKVAEQKLDAGERIEPQFVSFDQAVTLLARDSAWGEVPRLATHALYSSEKRQELQELLYGDSLK